MYEGKRGKQKVKRALDGDMVNKEARSSFDQRSKWMTIVKTYFIFYNQALAAVSPHGQVKI